MAKRAECDVTAGGEFDSPHAGGRVGRWLAGYPGSCAISCSRTKRTPASGHSAVSVITPISVKRSSPFQWRSCARIPAPTASCAASLSLTAGHLAGGGGDGAAARPSGPKWVRGSSRSRRHRVELTRGRQRGRRRRDDVRVGEGSCWRADERDAGRRTDERSEAGPRANHHERRRAAAGDDEER